MQPYFFPYLGYFQLIAAVDVFVVYDNIQYVKGGWINRNRLCRNGEAVMFSLPLRRASDYLDVRERELAGDFKPEKLLNQFKGAYRRAPYYREVLALLEKTLMHPDLNLFGFLHHSLRVVCEHLGLETEIDHALRKHEKVLALCHALGAETYVNAIGGVDLYSTEDFAHAGVDLKFIRMQPIEYAQFDAPFVPALSIIDVLMFNSRNTVRGYIAERYELS